MAKHIYYKWIILFLIILLCTCSKLKTFTIEPGISDIPGWPMSGGNPQRTNFYPGSFRLPLELVWAEKLNAAIGRTIIVVDSVIYFGTLNGELNAYAIADGEHLNSRKFRYPPTPMNINGHLIVALRYGGNTLYHIDLSHGTVQWSVNAGDIDSEPLLTSQGIVIASLYNHVDLYTADRRVKLWTFKTEDQIHSSPTLADSDIIFGSDDGYIYSIDLLEGELNWKFRTDASVQSTASYSAVLNRVFIGSSDRNLYALNAADGSIVWHHASSGQLLNGIATDDLHVVFGSTDSRVYCLDAETGDINWQFAAESVISTNPLIADDKVIFGSLDRNLYVLNLADGSMLWNKELKGRIRTSPVVWGDYLICASEDSHIYVFRASSSSKN
ncbi:PQQ-binding-like beta-propeller repeat protein [candidate division KSB1 bacterium]|nr:PQQ-binding-like beta-propeller repeat protein [candidate division KSB1 bacterium]